MEIILIISILTHFQIYIYIYLTHFKNIKYLFINLVYIFEFFGFKYFYSINGGLSRNPFTNSVFLPHSILHSRSGKLIIRRNQISKIHVRPNLHYNLPINASNVQSAVGSHNIHRALFPDPIPCSNFTQFAYLLLQSPINEVIVELQQTNKQNVNCR